jgi:hypothetical protein
MRRVVVVLIYTAGVLYCTPLMILLLDQIVTALR